jgi:protein SCO1/2
MALATRSVALVALLLVTLAPPATAERDAPKGANKSLPVVAELPLFSFVDQDGQRVGNGELAGHVWIADFIFTRCTTSCPILSSKMVLLQRALADPALRFVSFSVDPAHDTPAKLKEYASRWRAETRWRLLSTTKRSLRTLAAVVGVDIGEETADPVNPIVHTDDFLLVDRAGLVRGVYRSEDARESARLIADVKRLATAAAAPPRRSDAASGAQLFGELGCAGCHSDAHIATPLGGTYGTVIKLADGRTTKVDDAYLRESILEPNAKLAAGYPPSMPSFAGVVDAAQLDALVAYLKTLPAAAPVAARQRAVDPVCKMELSAGTDTPRVEHGGRTYYFCSEACRSRFAHDPERYGR